MDAHSFSLNTLVEPVVDNGRIQVLPPFISTKNKYPPYPSREFWDQHLLMNSSEDFAFAHGAVPTFSLP